MPMRGVLHRDIKPSNVLLVCAAGEGPIEDLSVATPKLMDFGLAKLADGTREMTAQRDAAGYDSLHVARASGRPHG